MSNPEIGRVLRANTAGFAVGCRVSQLHLPGFGALVKAQPLDEGDGIYGLIYDMHVDDDPLVRRLILAENPSPTVINDQRQNRMLPVEMSVVAVGYQQDGLIRHGLPPRPPLNLDPVFLIVDREEVAGFTSSLAYLRMILRAVGSQVPVDQLLVAHVVDVYQNRGDDVAWVKGVVTELVELLRSNYEMLIPTIESLSEALPDLPVEMQELVDAGQGTLGSWSISHE